jgi:hypothetical protein
VREISNACRNPFFFINRQKVPSQIVGSLNVAALGREVRSLNGSVLEIDAASQFLGFR